MINIIGGERWLCRDGSNRSFGWAVRRLAPETRTFVSSSILAVTLAAGVGGASQAFPLSGAEPASTDHRSAARELGAASSILMPPPVRPGESSGIQGADPWSAFGELKGDCTPIRMCLSRSVVGIPAARSGLTGVASVVSSWVARARGMWTPSRRIAIPVIGDARLTLRVLSLDRWEIRLRFAW